MGSKTVFRKCVKLGGFFFDHVISTSIYSDVCLVQYYRDLSNHD